ncbi:MAG: DUF2946 family protein [Burkholderiaceae bacterium]|nr:DUF2946 family protein [Burkholderiaceae bacterium]
MDNSVIAAMARWPQVPDVYGWLSLNIRGQWRLHPQGDAISQPHSSGTSISSPQILHFINNNYSHDPLGQWYFQNGPQRVYVRLDAAPFIFHTTGEKTAAGTPKLHSHNGLDAGQISAWRLDDEGRLYVQTQLGPGLIAGRDLADVLQNLRTTTGSSVLDALPTHKQLVLADGADFTQGTAANIAKTLGYVLLPTAI